MWVVDVNRQSLDRVIPEMKVQKLMRVFADSGWHVVEAKYGQQLCDAFERPGGAALRRHVDDMSNERYQSLFSSQGAELRDKFCSGPTRRLALRSPTSNDDLAALIQNLGGHDHRTLLAAFRACDAVTDRPSIVFAYTIKGWGLPIAGDPLNRGNAHRAADLRAPPRLDERRRTSGIASARQ